MTPPSRPGAPATPVDPGAVQAVVVTFDRQALLRRILLALDAQDPRPGGIVVVDNASTDGTSAMLAELVASLVTPVRVLTLDRNRGGAGGFHAGLAAAMDAGAELAWLMDDDGVPEPGCLATLLAERGDREFTGPVVVAEHDPARLCFPIRLPGTSTVLRDTADLERAAADGVVPDVVIPFNGVLVTRSLVDRIGLPREEFFIWGDDVEYLWRARRAGADVGTVAAARFRHPATDDLGTPMMGGRTTYNHSPSDLKHYCMCRNNVVNLRDYVGWHGVAAFVVKTLWFYSVTRRDRSRLRLSLAGVRAGLRGDFEGHRRFLS